MSCAAQFNICFPKGGGTSAEKAPAAPAVDQALEARESGPSGNVSDLTRSMLPY
jgi:hypothetical protein